jgi:Putative stress-responsive transcriptional regulator
MSEYDHDTFEWRRELRALKQNRLNGWGMGWFRNTRAGKIGGVAAGLADSWGLEHWVVRIAFVAAFLFTGMLAFWAYVAGWVLLAPEHDQVTKPSSESDWQSSSAKPKRSRETANAARDSAFRYRKPAKEQLREVDTRLSKASVRVAQVERYVTSRRFKLNQAFEKL